MGLEDYHRKRSFANTPEPKGEDSSSSELGENQWRFAIQKHDASRLHYDLRLELNGVLLSWAIPKGPSLDWAEKRLAIHVEDHPIEYLEFEGVIPQHEYGGGTVMVWDLGNWIPRNGPDKAINDYQSGELKFDLAGEKLQGGWMLKRLDHRGENQWLMIKEKDTAMRETADFEVLGELPCSVLTGRDLEEIAADRSVIWSSEPKQPYALITETMSRPERRTCWVSFGPAFQLPLAMLRRATSGSMRLNTMDIACCVMLGKVSRDSSPATERIGPTSCELLLTLLPSFHATLQSSTVKS